MRSAWLVAAWLAGPSLVLGTTLVNQTPVSGGGVTRTSQLWQDPTPAGNNLDGDSVCWADFTLTQATSITRMEWWGTGACELGFRIEYWPQDPGTIAYQPLGVFYYGNSTNRPTPTARHTLVPGDYATEAGPGGLTHYVLDLASPVSLGANDSTNPRWFVGVIGLTQQAYATWNWAQAASGTGHTFQYIRVEGPTFRSLGEGRALVLADASVPEPAGVALLLITGGMLARGRRARR